ncbi:hypothetical protein [Paenibacillus sp. sgz5001063]|uniref:hypothetical protein n=1 Tax=Paenibacillus sp. sgz5001063 TaxID=3242474 RepID=UPI0036D2C799
MIIGLVENEIIDLANSKGRNFPKAPKIPFDQLIILLTIEMEMMHASPHTAVPKVYGVLDKNKLGSTQL